MNDIEREWKNLAKAQAILSLQNIRTNEQLAQKIWLNYQQYRSLKSIWNSKVDSSGEVWKKDLLGNWWNWEDRLSIHEPLLREHESTDRILRENFSDYDKLRFSDKLFLNQLYWYAETILKTPLQFQKLNVTNGILENIETSLGIEIKFVKTDRPETHRLEEKILYIFKDENDFFTPVLETKREDFTLAKNVNWSTAILSSFLWGQE